MTQISNFVQVRADGKLVPSSMTVKEMLNLGWAPEKVIALKWSFGGHEVEVDVPHGTHGIVVPGANFVAMIRYQDEIDGGDRLIILSPDGSVHLELENRVPASGRELVGRYSWFEPAMTPRADTFGVVFQTDAEGAFRCDVDAQGPRFMSVVNIR